MARSHTDNTAIYTGRLSVHRPTSAPMVLPTPPIFPLPMPPIVLLPTPPIFLPYSRVPFSRQTECYRECLSWDTVMCAAKKICMCCLNLAARMRLVTQIVLCLLCFSRIKPCITYICLQYAWITTGQFRKWYLSSCITDSLHMIQTAMLKYSIKHDKIKKTSQELLDHRM